jgi:hypothetical protein
MAILVEKANIFLLMLQAVHPFSASIFLGFHADPSLNVAAWVRGPNVCSRIL